MFYLLRGKYTNKKYTNPDMRITLKFQHTNHIQ